MKTAIILISKSSYVNIRTAVGNVQPSFADYRMFDTTHVRHEMRLISGKYIFLLILIKTIAF